MQILQKLFKIKTCGRDKKQMRKKKDQTEKGKIDEIKLNTFGNGMEDLMEYKKMLENQIKPY